VTSIGGGAGLLVLVVIGAFFSESVWLRLVCRVYAGLYLLLAIGLVVAGRNPPSHLMIPLVFVVFALYVMEVRKSVGDPP
jgi:hypothetical protein